MRFLVFIFLFNTYLLYKNLKFLSSIHIDFKFIKNCLPYMTFYKCFYRLMQHCRVIDDEICFPSKDAYNLYELFHTRYSLFKQVYLGFIVGVSYINNLHLLRL